MDSNQIKLKTKFDLNLNQLKKDQQKQHEVLMNQGQMETGEPPEGQNEGIEGRLLLKKQIKTTQNSNENSQNSESQKLLECRNMRQGVTTITNSNEEQYNYEHGDQQQLNQSFSLKNIQQNADNLHEVESLMMNRQICQKGQSDIHPMNEAAATNVPINCMLGEPGQVPSESEKKGLQVSQSQNLKVPDKLNMQNQSVN